MSLSKLEIGGFGCIMLNRVSQYRLICTVLFKVYDLEEVFKTTLAFFYLDISKAGFKGLESNLVGSPFKMQ